jgi:alanine dehydrogenase
MGTQKQSFIKISSSEQLLPKEELLMTKTHRQSFTIGVPKETTLQENRVSIVPSAVALLVENGHRIIVERGAGIRANFEDREYAESGAELVESAEVIYQSDIVIKIAPPSIAEINMMKERLVLISALHNRAQEREYFKALLRKKVTALSFEHVRDKSNEHPILHSISEIVGSTSILIAAEYLSHPNLGRGKMLGGFTGINPSEVVIIGAGTVAESAAKTVLGLGALVKVFDNSISKLRRLQNNIHERIFSSIIQPDVLSQALKTADVVIGALYIRNDNAFPVVTEEMVKNMKKGSVIVDVSIDRGGCFETSRPTNHINPIYQVHDVTHYCVPNISSRTPHTSSYALSNYFAPFILQMSEYGGFSQMLVEDPGIRKGVYIYNGKLTFARIARRFKLDFQDLNLLLAAFR